MRKSVQSGLALLIESVHKEKEIEITNGTIKRASMRLLQCYNFQNSSNL